MLACALLAVVVAHAPAQVRGDFDHDGKPDVAEFVAGAQGSYWLVVRRGGPGHTVSLIATFTREELPNLYVTTAKPGRWSTWCGKGGGSDTEPCPRKFVQLRGETLDFGMKESTESVAIWNGKRFEVVLLSD